MPEVEWVAIKDALEVLSLVAALVMFVLVMYLKRYFPTREELANTYVTSPKFANEMRTLRDELNVTLLRSSEHTEKVIEKGIQALRHEVNQMGGRIDKADKLATSADAVATRTLELLARVESNSGELRAEVRSLATDVNKLGKDIGYIKGLLDKDSPR